MPNKKQVEELMQENMRANPEFIAGYWFPDENEYHLLYVDETIVPNDPNQGVATFRLVESKNGSELTMSVGLVRSEEVGKVPLPAAWKQTWNDANKVNAA